MEALRSLSRWKIIQKVRKLEKAIKEDCHNCMGGQKRVDCELETCPLYSFRPWAKKTAKTDFKKDNKFHSLAKTGKSS